MRVTPIAVPSLFAVTLAACASSAPVATPPPAPVAAPAPAPAPDLSPSPIVDSTALQPGRFDAGKMWTFDNPPLAYFQEAYGFRPDSAWFAHARLGALRFADYCSASFVSARGLVLTNHHCSRENTDRVLKPGENFDSTGFIAATQAEERRVPDLFVEQLLSITDVTADVDSALKGVTGDAERSRAREQAINALEQRLTEAANDSTIRVQVVTLYEGAQFSAYRYRRYDDVRLVLVPELSLAYFGGDDDNFTYPRYNLDFALYRVYDESGKPLATSNYFRVNGAGASEGDPVFVVGNPGSTSRLETVAQLAYARDVRIPAILALLRSRIGALETFQRAQPAKAAELHVQTDIFSYANAEKAYDGQLAGLHDPVLFGRRERGEAAFRAALGTRAALIDSIAADERERTALGLRIYAIVTNPRFSSATLARATLLTRYQSAKGAGAPAALLGRIADAVQNIGNQPAELEQLIVTEQFRDLIRALGQRDTLVVGLLAGRSPEAAAADVLKRTALSDSARVATLLGGDLAEVSSDPALEFAQRVMQFVSPLRSRAGTLAAQIEDLGTRLARARFDVYGKALPPDATFTLRLADGVVKGYPYNGTRTLPFTTFYGMYDRYSAAHGKAPWNLPVRWQHPPKGLDLSTRLNMASTNDIIGGNSGSPLLNTKLEVVGLIFDGNIESLPNEFIYTDERARAIAVDVRGILAALRTAYGAGRLAKELEGR